MRTLPLRAKVCLADLLIFAASFIFFVGPHGPIGPMLVLSILNYPVHWTALQLMDHYGWHASGAIGQIAASFLVVGGVNGYLYGALAEGSLKLKEHRVRAYP